MGGPSIGSQFERGNGLFLAILRRNARGTRRGNRSRVQWLALFWEPVDSTGKVGNMKVRSKSVRRMRARRSDGQRAAAPRLSDLDEPAVNLQVDAGDVAAVL